VEIDELGCVCCDEDQIDVRNRDTFHRQEEQGVPVTKWPG
jgi:hypothetical protein